MSRRKKGGKSRRKVTAPISATLSLTHVPETVADIRHEVAAMLCQVAEDAQPRVATRLLEIAAAFEAGQSPVD